LQIKKCRWVHLRDLDLLGKAPREKPWWRWLDNPNTPWVWLWKVKYAPKHSQKYIIRLLGQTLGSIIWNHAWRNKEVIHRHNFWEIHNGENALFWKDAWQQLPTLSNEHHASLERSMQAKGKFQVA